MGLVAYIDDSLASEKRRAPRRTLRLEVGVATGAPEQARMMIHDLSPTGLLVEAEDGPTVGEKLQIELPGSGSFPAKVMWSSGRFVGCKFEQVLPQAAISAALLKSVRAPERTAPAGNLTPVQELQARVQRLVEGGEAVTEGSAAQVAANDDRLPFHVRGRIMLGLSLASAGVWGALLWAIGVI
ncbi:PilZ domain-containing protein [Sphingomonas sp. BN140010]|uniref:PilZ domain-containing protein n=1 Tax=Sphingomonas arvum TaxID=2992113 RepID=A0ABT3JFN5_9SPHN|nr:PilZ domain-containing protein [Sphingomonas sp. BN140010]MCW3797821.1 PilZ domain-containing protein [Sphingomonas sp. BN140010]